LGKGEQKTPDNDKRDQERGDAFVYPAYRLLGDVLYHKNTDSHRGDNHTDHHNHADDDTEPDGIEPELQYGRVEDRRGKDHERKVIDEGTPYLVNDTDQKQDDITVNRQRHQPVRRFLRDIGHRDEVAKYYGACNEHQNHPGRTKGFRE